MLIQVTTVNKLEKEARAVDKRWKAMKQLKGQ
jgi:hypothetical protein